MSTGERGDATEIRANFYTEKHPHYMLMPEANIVEKNLIHPLIIPPNITPRKNWLEREEMGQMLLRCLRNHLQVYANIGPTTTVCTVNNALIYIHGFKVMGFPH